MVPRNPFFSLTLQTESEPIEWPHKSGRMRFQLTTILLAASATVASANPTWQSLTQWQQGSQGKGSPDHTSTRPTISFRPKTPHIPPPCPPPRHKVCYVKSHNDGITDDSSYVLEALHACNNGGHVVFKQGIEYLIATALDLTFLNSIDLGKLVPKSITNLRVNVANRCPRLHSLFK